MAAKKDIEGVAEDEEDGPEDNAEGEEVEGDAGDRYVEENYGPEPKPETEDVGFEEDVFEIGSITQDEPNLLDQKTSSGRPNKTSASPRSLHSTTTDRPSPTSTITLTTPPRSRQDPLTPNPPLSLLLPPTNDPLPPTLIAAIHAKRRDWAIARDAIYGKPEVSDRLRAEMIALEVQARKINLEEYYTIKWRTEDDPGFEYWVE